MRMAVPADGNVSKSSVCVGISGRTHQFEGGHAIGVEVQARARLASANVARARLRRASRRLR